MDTIRLFFWEAVKALILAILGLLAAQAVGKIQTQGSRGEAMMLRLLRGTVYFFIIGAVVMGARNIGYNIAAQLYIWASQDDLAHGQFQKAYDNSLHAVRLRPGVLRYWRTLALAKLAQHQYASALNDLPAFQSLSGGKLDEEDTYRFAVCYLYLAQYDQVIPLTQRLIRENPSYAAPYVLQGIAYIAQKKYPEAERSFLEVVQMFPSHQAAVEGLAHAYFLAGNRARAVEVLSETAKYPFPAAARKRFEALKALYAQ